MAFLEIARACIARGWHVFPCKGKEPLTKHAHKDASSDEAQVRAWWARTPDANVAIAPGPSGITVLDVDSGLDGEDSLRAFCEAHGIPETFAVRTGKRPQYRVQLYFAGSSTSLNGWEAGEYAGDLRGSWGYVMAAGCIHPESGERYEVLWDKPLAPVPDWVRHSCRAAQRQRQQPASTASRGRGPITEFRNDSMIGYWQRRAEGATDKGLREYAVQVNEERMSHHWTRRTRAAALTTRASFQFPRRSRCRCLAERVRASWSRRRIGESFTTRGQSMTT